MPSDLLEDFATKRIFRKVKNTKRKQEVNLEMFRLYLLKKISLNADEIS
jgi:hypothetical protein